jgi:hypothetical protein
MVNMANRPDVAMRLRPRELFLAHGQAPFFLEFVS